MPRPPASVVVPVWNAWAVTRRCLDSLVSSLGPRDQMVVVDNGSRDQTAAGLRRFPWVQVISNPTNLGFARACNQGAQAARHGAIVFLNNDTVVPAHWLDALLEPFQEAEVVASGPRSNNVSGPQLVPGADYNQDSTAEIRRFARDWMQANRGTITEVERLVGFCLAVRTESFREVGGFDEQYEIGGYEDDDLCLRLRRAGGHLVIAHGSFVHHQGHVTFDANGVSWAEQEKANRQRFLAKHSPGGTGEPLVSACLITKDEEENLPSCLASLGHLVDEVVVYDTGSSDGTVETARAAGCRVVEGDWSDDFSAARNAALAHCRGRWILWIDADETAVGEMAAVRARLAEGDPRVEGLQVQIENLLGTGMGSRSVHPACRLFRRDVGRWVGRFHEQVVGPDDRALHIAPVPELRLLHRGYTDAAMAERGKVERNLRLAWAEVEGGDLNRHADDPGMARANLGRTLFIAGRYEESLEECRRALGEAARPFSRRLALRMIIESQLSLGRPEEALGSVGELRAICGRQVLPDIMEARCRLLLGDPQGALDLLNGLGARETDDDAFEYSAEVLAPLRARSLAELHRPSAAADLLLAALSSGSCDVHVGTILELLMLAGRDPGDLGRAVPAHFYRPVLAQILQLAPDVADLTLEAWWSARPLEPTALLAAAANLAVRLPLVRSLEWSARLRQRGLAQACPLLRVAADHERPPAERVRAAAVAFGTFGGAAEREALRAALADVDPAHRRAVWAEVSVLCPRFDSEEPEAPEQVS